MALLSFLQIDQLPVAARPSEDPHSERDPSIYLVLSNVFTHRCGCALPETPTRSLSLPTLEAHEKRERRSLSPPEGPKFPALRNR